MVVGVDSSGSPVVGKPEQLTIRVGMPEWTEGHFERRAALDDLGIESVGASLLQEMIPGVVENTPCAGYYAFYPFLLQEFEREQPEALLRADFRSFYRRHEAAFAAGCVRHEHRGPLLGLQGSLQASRAAQAAAEGNQILDRAALAAPNAYMQTSLGGYSLFYRSALENIGAIRHGMGNQIDRVTDDIGAPAAEGFRTAIAETDYWQNYRTKDEVPLAVLDELAEATCPCDIPGRADHEPIIDVLFGRRDQSDRWASSRSYRVQSFGLLLEFHQQRSDEDHGTGAWRRALISGRLPDGEEWTTRFVDHREAWRAYQIRETLVVALGAVFTCFLRQLEALGTARRREVRELLVNEILWAELGVKPDDPTERLLERIPDLYDDPADLIGLAESVMDIETSNMSHALTSSVKLLFALANGADGNDNFQALLDRGGPARHSVKHNEEWFAHRRDLAVSQLVAELIDNLVYRHLRVATQKLSVTDHRDPFCIADDDGIWRVIRSDDPFWTGARFNTMNNLLWTAGALTSPAHDARPTELGLSLLEGISNDG
jgi:hypothetical protein